jgi:arginine N-succinyltransferase
MFLLREARPRDKRRLLELARLLDSVNMPTTARDMDDTLKRSRQSFRGRTRERARAVYMFCAEDLKTRRVAGASMIIAKHGTPASPHYYLQIDSDERYSHTLRKMFRHNFLRLRHSMDGPTEVGGLIVDPELRRLPEKVGKQLSWLRFLYIARHRKRFENRIIAEIMPPLTAERSNLFWDHYGRRSTPSCCPTRFAPSWARLVNNPAGPCGCSNKPGCASWTRSTPSTPVLITAR